MIYKKCERCGRKFRTFKSKLKIGQGIFCSRNCCKPPIIKNCEICGKSFRARPGNHRKGMARFCSKSCAIKSPDRKRASLKGAENPSWKGGRAGQSQGYLLIRINGKYVLEHRYIMSKYLGRDLLSEEVVHHINGNKKDNRIENLMLFSNTSEHMKEENKKRKFIYMWGYKYIREDLI